MNDQGSGSKTGDVSQPCTISFAGVVFSEMSSGLLLPETPEQPVTIQTQDWSSYAGRIPAKVVEDATITLYRSGLRAALFRRLGAILGIDQLWRRGVIERTGVTVVMEAIEDDEQ
jgi:hypothetical protein